MFKVWKGDKIKLTSNILVRKGVNMWSFFCSKSCSKRPKNKITSGDKIIVWGGGGGSKLDFSSTPKTFYTTTQAWNGLSCSSFDDWCFVENSWKWSSKKWYLFCFSKQSLWERHLSNFLQQILLRKRRIRTSLFLPLLSFSFPSPPFRLIFFFFLVLRPLLPHFFLLFFSCASPPRVVLPISDLVVPHSSSLRRLLPLKKKTEHHESEMARPNTVSESTVSNFTMCKWTRPFWATDCRRAPKSLASAQAAPPLFGVHLWKPFLGTYSWLFEPISGWEVVVQATISH